MFTRNATINKSNSRTDNQLTVRLVGNPVKATSRMRAVLCLFALIYITLACACPSPSCSEKPKFCNPAWNIRTFDSQESTKAIQGGWYLQAFSPLLIKDANPLVTGLFSPQYPCSNLKVMINDTTSNDAGDFNIDFFLTDVSYNQAIQRVELKKSLFMAAFGSKSPWAIFNVYTGGYYEQPIVEINPFTDDLMIKHEMESIYTRRYTLACIGSDDLWEKYLIFVLINQYDNLFNTNDNRIVWVFTRSKNPSPATYKRAFDDLIESGISPYYLMSMDQSLDLTQISTVNPDELYGITQQTVTQSSSTTSPDGSTITSSSTTTVTTVSTVNFVLNPSYVSPYEFDVSPMCGDIKVLKTLQPDIMSQIFNSDYYVKSTMPTRYYGPDVNVKPGLLNSGFPTTGLQVGFDKSNPSPWDYNTPRYMIDRAVDAITGITSVTRSIIMSSYDGSHPYNAISIYTEGYGPIPIDELSPLSIDDMISKSPGSIYVQQYILFIVAYQPNGFVIFYLANKYKNLFSPNSPVNPLFVLTNDRFPSPDVIENINQEILRIGYDSRYLTNVDQTPIIPDKYNFDKTFFYPDVPSPAGPGGSSPSSMIPNGSGPRSLGLPKTPGSPMSGPCSPTSGPRSPTSGPGSPMSGPGSSMPRPSGPMPGPSGPMSGPVTPMPGLPSYFPPQLQVKTFDSQSATKAIQGGWNLQLYSPTNINNARPMRTGLLYPQFPCANLKIMFNDTTPRVSYDFNIDYLLTQIGFNLITQRVEITKSLFKGAFGSTSQLAIFNVGTLKYFESPLIETNPFTDETLIRHKIESDCDSEYTIACIGADEAFEDYLIFYMINQYDNFFNANDNHIVWMFTRSMNPGPDTYKRAFDDLIRNGINPYNLMSMDQSVDFTKITTVQPEELYGITQETVTKSSTTSPDGTTSSSSTTVTTVSTLDFVPNPNYISPYEFDTSSVFGDIKVLKNLPVDVMTEIFSSQYFLKSAMPSRYYDQDVDAKVGLLNCGFPAAGVQVGFDNTNSNPWDYNTPRYMIDRAVNTITRETQVTRSLISSCYDGSYPYNAISIYSEGYAPVPIQEISPFSMDGMICKPPGSIYIQQYILVIVGYQKGDFVIFYLANKYKNMFSPDSPVNPLFVLTNERFPSAKVLEDIYQAVHLCGYDARYLSTIDQTMTIDQAYTFESSYFEMETVTSSFGSSTVTKSVSSSSVTTVC